MANCYTPANYTTHFSIEKTSMVTSTFVLDAGVATSLTSKSYLVK